MAGWFDRFRTRHPERDLNTDLERITLLDIAFAAVIDSAVRERDGLKQRVAEIAADAVLDTNPEGSGQASPADVESQMRATSARLARLEDQIRFFERMRSQLAARHATEPGAPAPKPIA